MAPPKESPLYESRHLPTEAQMTEIIESMIIHDPYNLPSLMSVTDVHAEVDTKYTTKITEYETELAEWNKQKAENLDGINEDDEPKRPEMPALPEYQRICPALSYRDDSLKRDVVSITPVTKETSTDYYYNWRSKKDNNSKYSAIQDTFKPLVESVWPANFREKINQSCDAGCLIETTKIQRGYELRSTVYNAYDRFLNGCAALERKVLYQKLREGDHIRLLGEIELRAEIRWRKKQYPGQRILVMLGDEAENYYMGVHKEMTLEGAILIQAPVRQGNHCFDKYETAVVAESQMKASHSFDFAYAIDRVNRGWNTAIGMILNLGIQVIPRMEERKTLNGQQTLFSLN